MRRVPIAHHHLPPIHPIFQSDGYSPHHENEDGNGHSVVYDDGDGDGLFALMGEKCFLYVLIVLSLPSELESFAEGDSVIGAKGFASQF